MYQLDFLGNTQQKSSSTQLERGSISGRPQNQSQKEKDAC